MKDFDKYLERSRHIRQQAEESGSGKGMALAWGMIIVGVIVTAIQTHALTYAGMKGSQLYEGWLDVASWLPVVLLEGSAVGLTLGRLYFFKGRGQRRLGHLASFGVWAVLAFNTLAQFAVSYQGQMPAPLVFYTRYILPLTIVAIPYLWKWLLDKDPVSEERIATLEVAAEYDEQWRKEQRAQNQQILGIYRDARQSQEVRDAAIALAKKVAIKRAAEVIGEVDDHEVTEAAAKVEAGRRTAELAAQQAGNGAIGPAKPMVTWRGGKIVRDERGN
jgi:hypothetical protein